MLLLDENLDQLTYWGKKEEVKFVYIWKKGEQIKMKENVVEYSNQSASAGTSLFLLVKEWQNSEK